MLACRFVGYYPDAPNPAGARLAPYGSSRLNFCNESTLGQFRASRARHGISATRADPPAEGFRNPASSTLKILQRFSLSRSRETWEESKTRTFEVSKTGRWTLLGAGDIGWAPGNSGPSWDNEALTSFPIFRKVGASSCRGRTCCVRVSRVYALSVGFKARNFEAMLASASLGI